MPVASLGQCPKDAGDEAVVRVHPHAARRWEAWLEDTAFAGDPGIEVAQQNIVDLEGWVQRQQPATIGHLHEAEMSHVIDRPLALLICFRGVQFDPRTAPT